MLVWNSGNMDHGKCSLPVEKHTFGLEILHKAERNVILTEKRSYLSVFLII